MLRKFIFNSLYYLGLPSYLIKRRIKKQELAVLLFHRINDQQDTLWPSMSVETFRNLITNLNKVGQFITFSELSSFKEYPAKPLFIISFDDGYKDFYEHALPVLKENNLKANHNICPGLIASKTPPWTQILSLYLYHNTSGNSKIKQLGEVENTGRVNEKYFLNLCKKLMSLPDEQRSELIDSLLLEIPKDKLYELMTWQEIKECAAYGIEIGSHGMVHRNLIQVTNPLHLEEEIFESSQKIEAETGIKPRVFAFANASGNATSLAYVIKSGYQFKLLEMDKVWKWKQLENNEVVSIPRVNMVQSHWQEEYLRALGFHEIFKKIFNK